MRTKKQIIFFHIVSWIIAYGFLGVMIFLLDEARAGFLDKKLEMDLFFVIRVLITAGIFVGIALGGIDILLRRISNKKHSFRFYIIIRSLLYTFAFVLILSVIITHASAFYVERVLQISIGEEGVRLVHNFIFTLTVYSIFVSILISFISEVNKKFGPGVLIRLLMGKYYNPKVEDRIFVFLDLKSSTTYAEKLGHIKYSELIQDCFNDLNIVVAEYKAEIYQYVGDEAVLTWTVNRGLENTNYLRFYFAFQDRIIKRSDFYKEKYGFVPEFKAGVNGGNITVTEIGDIKREIAYHGDVINTAARIQEVCNTYDKKLLISEFLAEKLDAASNYTSEKVGSILLKGKELPVSIFSVEMHS
ncbi:MAG: adenylate/guanylate cyclase domain-containing protein [Ignavibacteria bacterium]|nr:adenylate/guanylate cyclase domain-containing protein [Ignavibacteria bacterium]